VHTFCCRKRILYASAGKILSFGGAWGPRGSWGFGGCLWRRLSGGVSLKYGGGSIGGAVLLLLSGCRGVRAWLLLLSVRLWPAVHRRGSLTTGAAVVSLLAGLGCRGVVAPSGRLLSLLLAPSVGLSVGAVGLLPVGLRRRGVRGLNLSTW